MFFLVRRFTDLYPPDTWKRKDRNNRGDKKIALWGYVDTRSANASPMCIIWHQ